MNNAKEIVVQTAAELGFARVVVASLEPMEAARRFFEAWLAKGYAGSMSGWLARNPYSRTSPQLLHPEAYCALVLFVPYYTSAPPYPGKQFGKVARYAVGKDYHDVIPAKLELLKQRLEERLGRSLLGKYFTDDVDLFEPAFADRAGLGFTGKNTMIIGPKMLGSYHFVAELFTDLPLEPDEPYKGTCGSCFRCGVACPTDAIVEAGMLDARACISYLTIENKGDIPLELRSRLGSWVFGCDICQEVCPYNQRPPETVWQEFQPSSGMGHYLNLYDVLEIRDKKEFMAKVGGTPLSRPKRRGLIRNALVVLGNNLPDDGVERISRFAARESDPMLREHAFWALSGYKTHEAVAALEKLLSAETDDTAREKMNAHMLHNHSCK